MCQPPHPAAGEAASRIQAALLIPIPFPCQLLCLWCSALKGLTLWLCCFFSFPLLFPNPCSQGGLAALPPPSSSPTRTALFAPGFICTFLMKQLRCACEITLICQNRTAPFCQVRLICTAPDWGCSASTGMLPRYCCLGKVPSPLPITYPPAGNGGMAVDNSPSTDPLAPSSEAHSECWDHVEGLEDVKTKKASISLSTPPR